MRLAPLALSLPLQVHASYKKELASLPSELSSLLDNHAAVLAPPLRRALAQALILLHNRGAVEVRQSRCARPIAPARSDA